MISQQSIAARPACASLRASMDGFSLLEILVALAVFAAMAAISFGALSQLTRTHAALSAQQDRFAAVVRSMNELERDLRQAVSRPVRGNYGEPLPAVLGGGDRLELSRVGFANPRAQARSNIERVVYALDNRRLQRSRFAVLDRAPASVAQARPLLEQVDSLRFRYLAVEGQWSGSWPPRDTAAETLPRAIEFRIQLADYGELRRMILLPATFTAREPNPAGEATPGATP